MPSNRGYITGYKNSGSGLSTALDYVTFDTQQVGVASATLATARYATAGLNSSTVGYFTGGYIAANSAIIDGLNYSAESNHSVAATLSAARTQVVGLSKSTKGYTMGGYTTAANGRIDALTFSNDTNALLGASFASGTYSATALNSQNNGYTTNEYTTTYDIAYYKFIYSTETNAAIGAKALNSKYRAVGTYNNNYGYSCGGDNQLVTVERFNYATETNSWVANNLSVGRYDLGQTNSSTDGYLVGGRSTANAKYMVEDFNYATEIATILMVTLAETTYWATGVTPTQLAALSNSSTFNTPTNPAMYTVGGSDRIAWQTSVEKMIYSTEVNAYNSYTLNAYTGYTGTCNSGVAGYVCQGYSVYQNSNIDIIKFDDDTIQNKGIVQTTRRDGVACYSAPTKGYFAGGDTNVHTTTIDSLIYSSHTNGNLATVLASGNSYSAGLYSTTYGYQFAGNDITAGYHANVYKWSFSTETNSTSLMYLTRQMNTIGSVMSNNNGYAVSGYWSPGVCIEEIQRFNYTNEASVLISATMPVALRFQGTSASSSTAGYMSGIFSAVAGLPAYDIYKLTFSTEVCIDSSTKLMVPRQACMAVSTVVQVAPTDSAWSSPASGTYTKGYLLGGVFKEGDATFPLAVSDYINYSTGTVAPLSVIPFSRRRTGTYNSATAGYIEGGYVGYTVKTIEKLRFDTEVIFSIKANLSAARHGPVGMCSTTKGYACGGNNQAGTNVTTIDALTFSTDTDATIAAVLTVIKYASATVYNATNGYVVAGSPATGSTDKFVFSTETRTTTAKTAYDRYLATGNSSNNNGIITGGYSGMTIPVENIDLTNATISTLNQKLTYARYASAGVSSATTGYIAGGFNGSYDLHSIETVDFGTNVVNVSSQTLSVARDGISGINTVVPTTSTYASPTVPTNMSGYNVVGYNPYVGNVSQVDAFPYATETPISLVCGITVVRRNMSGYNSSYKGYACGGNGGIYSNIDAVQFDNSTVYQINASLTLARFNTAGFCSTTKGYTIGGNTGTQSTKIDNLVFSTEVTAANAAVLTVASEQLCGMSASDKGHVHCGNQLATNIGALTFSGETYALNTAVLEVSDSSYTSTIAPNFGILACGNNYRSRLLKFDFATLTQCALAATTTRNRSLPSAMSNTGTGYFAGGPSPSTNTIDKLNNYTFAVSLLAVKATVPCQYGVGLTSVVQTSYAAYSAPVAPTNANKGFYAGGTDLFATTQTKIDVINFVDGTTTASVYALQQAKTSMYGSAVTSTKGYMSASNIIENIRFDTEAWAKLNAVLSVNYSYRSANASITTGYWFGGNSTYNTVDGILFSTEAQHVSAGTLTSGNYSAASVSSSNFNYLCGGYTTGAQSYIQKYSYYGEYSTYNSTGLPATTSSQCGVETANFGYVCGGTAYINVIRINFANDTVATLSHVLPIVQKDSAGISQTSYGYVVGASLGADTIDRFNYSTESFEVYSNHLTSGKYQGAAFANVSTKGAITVVYAGYICGGTNASGPIATIDMLVYSTGAISALMAALTVARDFITSISSPTNGYVIGGADASFVAKTTIDKIVFGANACAAFSASLATGAILQTGINSTTNGYICGGTTSSFVASILNLTFAAATIATLGATLSVARNSAIGNQSSTKGYICGGYDGSTMRSTIDVFTFASNTNAASGNTLSSERSYGCAASSTTDMYIFGGSSNASAQLNTVQDLSFATTTCSILGATLAANKQSEASVQSATDGYITGGSGASSTTFNTVEDFVFSTATFTTFSSTLTDVFFVHAGTSFHA